MQKSNEVNFSFVFFLLSLVIILSIVSRFSFLISVQVAIFLVFTASLLFLVNNYEYKNIHYILPALFLAGAACLSYINADYQVNVRDNILVLVSALAAGFHVTFLSIAVRKKLFVVPVFVGLWLSMIVLSRFISVPHDFFSGNVSFYQGMALNINVIAGFLLLVYPLLFLLIKDSEKTISKVYIVTNQRGVGIGVMSEADLKHIHDYMLKEIVSSGGRLDGIYYCADADRNSLMRKPRPGMANKAKSEHPEIDFAKSVMVGNSISDMEFGRSVGMTTVFIDDKGSRNRKKEESMDYIFFTLKEFADSL